MSTVFKVCENDYMNIIRPLPTIDAGHATGYFYLLRKTLLHSFLEIFLREHAVCVCVTIIFSYLFHKFIILLCTALLFKICFSAVNIYSTIISVYSSQGIDFVILLDASIFNASFMFFIPTRYLSFSI